MSTLLTLQQLGIVYKAFQHWILYDANLAVEVEVAVK